MTNASAQPLIVYVDVDDTLVRSHGTKRVPMPVVVEHVRALRREGAELYCWSSGGGEYARASAEELGIADCFMAFLPKPHLLVDDQPIAEWRRFLHVHPSNCGAQTIAEYRSALTPVTSAGSEEGGEP